MKNIDKLLTVPGNGVFTVHTGADKKEKLHKAYYSTTKSELIIERWKKAINEIDVNKPILFGIPSDNGGGIHRGANWGPLALREELLDIKNEFQDLGDVRVIPHLLHDKYLNEKTIRDCQKALYGKACKLPVSPLSIAETALNEIYKSYPEAKILGLGGDHSTSYPLTKAWIASRKNKKKAAILHFDAHTDLLDKRMGIDICFGTWTYQILNDLASRDHIVQLGIRSSGKNKKYWKDTLGVEQYWAHEMNKLGVEKVYLKLKKHFQKLGVEELYISFDIDALDMKYACATGTPEKDGLTPTDSSLIIQLLSEDFNITGADIMEVAPFILPTGADQKQQMSSLTVAGDITKTLLWAM